MLRILDPVTFTEIALIKDTIILNVRMYFDLTLTEFNVLIAAMMLHQDKNFKANFFSRKDLEPFLTKFTETKFTYRRNCNLLMTSLTEKGFFTYIAVVWDRPGDKTSRITKYMLNKEGFGKFINIFHAFIAIEMKKFASIQTNSVGKHAISLVRKDAAKHMKKIKKLIKNK